VAAGFQTKTTDERQRGVTWEDARAASQIESFATAHQIIDSMCETIALLATSASVHTLHRGGEEQKNVWCDAFKNHPTNFFRVMSHRVSLHHTHHPTQ